MPGVRIGSEAQVSQRRRIRYAANATSTQIRTCRPRRKKSREAIDSPSLIPRYKAPRNAHRYAKRRGNAKQMPRSRCHRQALYPNAPNIDMQDAM